MQKMHIWVWIAFASKLAKSGLQGQYHKANLTVPLQSKSPPDHSYLGAGPNILVTLIWAVDSLYQHCAMCFWVIQPSPFPNLKESLGRVQEQPHAPFQLSFSGGNKHTRVWKWMHEEDRSCKTYMTACAVSIYVTTVKASPNNIITAAFGKPGATPSYQIQ